LCFVFGVWYLVYIRFSAHGMRFIKKHKTLNTKLNFAWILHGPEAFIGKAYEVEVVIVYFESSFTPYMKVSGSPLG